MHYPCGAWWVIPKDQPPWPPTTKLARLSPPRPSSKKQSKAMDMRFYWIRDRVRQGQFLVYWKRGKTNQADYFTKHHPAKHHIQQRPNYLQRPSPTQAANYYAPLCLDPPPSSNKPTTCGEGVLIPSERAAPALRPMLTWPARRAPRSA